MEGKIKKRNKLWNKDFTLLWQGQLVSYLGDVIYSFALSFWVLEVTGSTALMGFITAASMVPRLILGPFAGVLVDKWNRKKIIVMTDAIRGILSTFVGIAALMGFLEVWMVFFVGIATSLCSAFFNPAITSVKPDIVDKDVIVKANSATSFADAGASMFGNLISGVLYATVGAPYMFLFDGISYIFSAFTELFIKVPKIVRKKKEVTFKEDFKEGLAFTWKFKALRYMFIFSCGINFLFNAAFILMVPLFKEASYLGTDRYGIVMSASAVGMMVGSLLLSIINIKNNKRYIIMGISFIAMSLIYLMLPVVESFYAILIFSPIAQCLNMIGNTISNSSLMLIIPDDKRGKVFSLLGTFSMGLMPLGTCIGGILGEILSIRVAMFTLLFMTFLGCISMILIKPIKLMINYNSEDESIEELIERSNKAFKKKQDVKIIEEF